MRTELTEVVEKIRRQVLGQRAEIDQLNGLLNDDEDDTTVDLTYFNSNLLVANSMISVGLEDMRVMAKDASANQVTVIRAFGDSEVEYHQTDDVVWIQPRFTSTDILDALRDEIMSWGPQLYQVYTAEHTVGDAAETFELPVAYVGMYGILDAVRYVDPPAGSDPLSTVTAWPRVELRLQRFSTAWTGATTSGILVRFIEPRTASKVLISAAIPFTTSAFDTAGCDLVDDVGLAESMIDLACLGVKMRLLVDAEAMRSARDVSEDPRRAEEVPPAAALQSANAYQALYRRRMAEEVAKLVAAHPIRMHAG